MCWLRHWYQISTKAINIFGGKTCEGTWYPSSRWSHSIYFTLRKRAKLKIDILPKAEQKINIFYFTFRVWNFIVGMCCVGLGFRQLSFKTERICTALSSVVISIEDLNSCVRHRARRAARLRAARSGVWNLTVVRVEELKTNLMSLVIFISLNICSTCFGH